MGMGLHGALALLRDLSASKGASGNAAMLHTGRVGSTVVADMLEKHPQLLWDGEIFERRMQRRRAREQSREAKLLKRDLLPPLVDLRACVGAATRSGLRYGFETKHHYEQHGYIYGLRIGPYIEQLLRLGFDHFIEVRRENYLRQVVSGIRLRQTGKSHARTGERIEREPLIIDPLSVPIGRVYLSLLERFAELDALHQETVEALQGRKVLYLTYERDIEQDPTAAYARVCEFLDLKTFPGQPALRRTNDAPLAELIGNFDEVADVLAGTKYEWMLEGSKANADKPLSALEEETPATPPLR